MTNSNCLEGMECPHCNSEGPFKIHALVLVLVSDDGTEGQGGDYEWDEESFCECVNCNHTGTIKDFKLENHDPTYHNKMVALNQEVDQIHHDYQAGKYDAAKRDELLKMIRKAIMAAGMERKKNGDV